VGTITQITGKSFMLRRALRLSDSSWSMEPGAVSKAADLRKGDKIFAQGKTQSDGAFNITRIYLLSHDALRQENAGGTQAARSSDYGGPESSPPPNIFGPPNAPIGRGGGNIPGQESRIPGPGRPGDAGQSSPGGLQDPRGSRLTRYHSWDADGVIDEVGANSLSLNQTYFFDKETTVLSTDGKKISTKVLKAGMRVAVTVKDEVDEKTHAIKARVMRVLPQ
jgi:hypothetical protein